MRKCDRMKFKARYPYFKSEGLARSSQVDSILFKQNLKLHVVFEAYMINA